MQLFNQGAYSAAATQAQALTTRYPGHVFGWKALGAALIKLRRSEEALAPLQKAALLLPTDAEVHSNLGAALREQGRVEDAVLSYRRALAIKPDSFEAHTNLANALSQMGQVTQAMASYRRALAIMPGFASAHSGLLYSLTESEEATPEQTFDEHCRFAERFEAPLRPHWPQHGNSRDPERCLQIGFVSPDLYEHPVAFFFEPVLAQLAGQPLLTLHAYDNNTIEDTVTQRLRGLVSHWHPIAGLTDQALAQKIMADGIDILFDLTGHTANNRLLTFARKPAPIQVTWIGYPNTSGLQAMDYTLSDRFIAPIGLYEHFYVEKFARLPSSGAFLPVATFPALNALPALNKGHVTFGSFNRASKLGDQVVAVWCRVLHAVPGSCLLLGNVSNPATEQQLRERFARHGIAPERLTFHPRLPMQDYLALHHEVDLILDTWPYTGGTTTNYALWMGVPVLTLLGPARSHCQSAAALSRLGLAEWVAHDVDEYVAIAVRWAQALPALAHLRANLRQRCQSNPSRQPSYVARLLAQALRVMWQRWCAGLPAAHFEIEADAQGVPVPTLGQPMASTGETRQSA